MKPQNRIRTCRLSAVSAMALLCLGGCANPTAVHIYGKYFEGDSLQPIKETLQAAGYEVQINSLDVPASVTDNSILYSLTIQNDQAVSEISEIATQAGYKIVSQMPLTRSNHWYTKNSVALILFPDDASATSRFYPQDLIHSYQTAGCETPFELKLSSDGQYQLSGFDWPHEQQEYLQGTWHFRQYPYIELRPASGTQWHMYYEIEQATEQDNISQIAFLRLKPIEPYALLQGCFWENGLRQLG